MTSYEGSFLTSEIEEIPNTPMSESSATRDSVATYTTDLDDSSMVSMETDSNYVKATRVSSQRKSIAQENGTPFYHRKRFWAMCAAISIVISAIFIPLMFLVIIPNIAQSSVNKSNIDFDAINITNPKNDSFLVSMSGKTSGTGPFSATITFNGPVTILYKDNVLGSIIMDPISVSGGEGTLVGATRNFTIVDKGIFYKFASEVMVAKEFEWVLRGSASVKTLGISINGLKLNKVLKIPGSNNFVTNLLSLKANENPDKTLSLEVVTSIFNPSPIGIELGDMTVQLNSDTTILTIVTAKNVFLGAKQNNITMTGNTFLPKTEQDRLNAIKVINGYLSNTQVNTTANVLSVLPKSGPVDWLSSVVQNLTLVTSVGSFPPAQKIISNLDFGQIKMTFTPDDPYSPTISSSNTIADYALPFNINFKILNVGQKLTLATNDYKEIASIESPQVPVNSTDKEISLSISETKMKILDAGKFSDLFAALTTGKEASVVIYGKSDIDTDTDSLGLVPIRGLPFNLTTSFQGFQQFNSDGNSPSVSNLNILEGTSNQLYIGVVVVLTNPTHYSISVGKVSLDIFFKEKKIGTAVIPDFSVGPGPNSVEVLTILDDPANNDVGKELLDSFLTGKEITVNIKGSNNSTSITSLIPAFRAIDIPTVFPPSQTPFLKSAKIVIDDQTPTTNISTGIAELSNPYDTPISIYNMNSSYSYNGQTIGTVEQDFGNTPLFVPGNSVQNLTLPVKMVLDPVLSFTILRDSAIRNNLDVTVLDSLIAFSNLTVPGANPNPNPTPQAISSFNLATFVTTALANIPITVNIEAQVAIGFYIMKMTYKQVVISSTDESILKLIPALSQPLIQNTMQQSQMSFDSIFMQNIDVASFDVLASGQVTNTGPLPAQISFPNGLTVSSNNIVLGTATLPPIITDPSGTKFNNVSRFNIADVNTFASFSQNAFLADTISWDIAADNVVITAFGLPIGPISLRKTVQISGFSGLKQYQLQDFNPFPLTITIGLNNPSVVGAEIGTVVYDLVVSDEKIATVTGNNIVITPHAVSSLKFTGDLNLATINPNVAQSFFSDNPPIVVAKGVSVTPPKATGEVVWLLASFKSLSLAVPFSVKLLIPKSTPGLPGAPGAPAAPAAPIPS